MRQIKHKSIDVPLGYRLTIFFDILLPEQAICRIYSVFQQSCCAVYFVTSDLLIGAFRANRGINAPQSIGNRADVQSSRQWSDGKGLEFDSVFPRGDAPRIDKPLKFPGFPQAIEIVLHRKHSVGGGANHSFRQR